MTQSATNLKTMINKPLSQLLSKLIACMLASALLATSVHAQALPVPPDPPTPTLPNNTSKPPSNTPTAANDPSYSAKAKLGAKIGKLGKLGARLGKLANPYGLAGEFALNKLLSGIDNLLEQGRGPLGHSAPENISEPPKSDYPIVYIFDRKQFYSISELKNYILGEYLTKRGLKLTRNKEGLYYQHLYLNYQSNCYACDGFGYFNFDVQTGYISSNYSQNIGGSLDRYQGIIAYDGKVDTQDVVNPAQDELNRLIDEYETAINAQPEPEPNPDSKPEPNPDSNPNPNPNPNNKKGNEKQEPKNFELPDFCNWATTVCNLADFIMQEPNLNDEQQAPTKQIELKNPSDFDKDYVNANAQCPNDIVKEFTTGFQNEKITFSFTPICDFANDYLRPVILFLAYLVATITIANAFKVE